MLLSRDGDGKLGPFDATDTSTSPATTTRACRAPARVLDELTTSLRAVGIDVYQIDHEDANGQFEVNFTYADALNTADNFIFFKMAASEIARKHGMIATFMPKPFSNRTGSGAHFHISHRQRRAEEPVRGRRRIKRGLELSTAGLSVPRRRARARAGAGGGVRADGELVQAARRRARAVGRDLGAGVHRLRRQQPHGVRAHSRRPARAAPAGFGLQSLPRDARRSSPRASTASSASSIRASRTTSTCTSSPRSSCASGRSACCRRTCWRRSDALEADEVVKPGSARSSRRSSSQLKRMEWIEYARHVSDWETQRYLEFF